MKSILLKVAIKWTWILSGGMIILTLINYVIGFENLKGGLSIITQLIWWVFLITCLAMSNSDYRKNHLNGYMKYGQAFGLGVLVGLFSSIVFSLFNYLFYQFIDFETFKKTVEFAITEIDKNENIPAEMKENMIMNMVEQTPLSTSFQYLWSSNIINLILMLIIAAFTKKKNNTFDETFKDVM